MRICLEFILNASDYLCYIWGSQDCFSPVQERLSLEDLAHRLHTAEDYQLDILLPEHLISSRQIELPHLGHKKARQALGFALEEEIARPLEEVHWSFSRNDYGYLVRIMDKSILQNLHERLVEHALQARSVVCPSMLLPKDCLFFLPDTLLCTHRECTGAIPYAQASLIGQYPLTYFVFQDSPKQAALPEILSLERANLQTLPTPFQNWLVERWPSWSNESNLLQGEFEPKTEKLALRFWQILCLGLLGLCLISALGLSLFAYLHNRAELQTLNKAIERDYKHFFPNASQVISPKFRVEQLLKSRHSGSNALFWLYLRAINRARVPDVALQYWRFQDEKARLKVSARNFTLLKTYSQKLEQSGVRVKQLRANSADNRVLAELELFR